MRYIYIGGEVIPKHCKFGPRPREGVVLSNYEWWSITDHLVKEQRERDLAAVLRAKDEAKKDVSFEMTRNWSNTLASIKTQGDQKRKEKMEKIQQAKIEAYNRIIESRKEEKKKIVDDVKKILFLQKDPVLTMNSTILFAQVLDERRKQIEEQNMRKKIADEADQEWIMKIKRLAQDEERENLEKKIKEQEKKKIRRLELDEQVAEIRRRREEIESAEKAAELEDVKNMMLEAEKIHKCNMLEREYRKKFNARYIRKTKEQLEYERTVMLEEKEEDDINKIYDQFNRRYKKERKEKEERIMNEKIEKRGKITEMLAQKLLEARQKEEDIIQASVLEKENKEKAIEEEKERLRRLALADLIETKRKADEERKRKAYEWKEEKKWELMQLYRTYEINQKWREDRAKQEKEIKAEMSRILNLQCQELRERRAEEKREFEAPLEDEEKDKEELRQYLEEALQYAREEKLPEYPILRTIKELKKQYNLFTAKELEEMKKETEKTQRTNDCGKRKQKIKAVGCYCLKN